MGSRRLLVRLDFAGAAGFALVWTRTVGHTGTMLYNACGESVSPVGISGSSTKKVKSPPPGILKAITKLTAPRAVLAEARIPPALAVGSVNPVLLDPALDSSFIISPADGQDAEAMFYKVCAEYPKSWKVEQGANGDIRIMPPQGTASSGRCSEINYQLRAWAKRDGRGRVLDSRAKSHLL
jgi:hypothetical protein